MTHTCRRKVSGGHPALVVTTLALVAGFGFSARADNVCGETVPANRFIDGFPAYAQCTASTRIGDSFGRSGLRSTSTWRASAPILT